MGKEAIRNEVRGVQPTTPLWRTSVGRDYDPIVEPQNNEIQ